MRESYMSWFATFIGGMRGPSPRQPQPRYDHRHIEVRVLDDISRERYSEIMDFLDDFEQMDTPCPFYWDVHGVAWWRNEDTRRHWIDT